MAGTVEQKLAAQGVSLPEPRAAMANYVGFVRTGSLLFVSGQVPVDPATGELVAGTIATQTRRALENIGEILKAGGASFQQVVRTTVYLADLADFPAMNETYATFFSAPQPARSTIQAANLPKGARIEIDAIAYLG